MTAPRIGLFTHSTNPRGGVVHAMQLAEAILAAGGDATLLAPALPGQMFFRRPRCPSRLIPAAPVAGTVAMVAQRIGEIAAFLSGPGAPRFDVYHAGDSISANALAELGLPFARTVHHLDRFSDARLDAWQDRGVRAATRLCCVSPAWGARIAAEYGRQPVVVGNGVDAARFTPAADDRDAGLQARIGAGRGPVFLMLGGVEGRKNTLGALRGFLLLKASRRGARLVIAGGATLLEHGVARAAFDAELAGSGATDAVTEIGVVADEQMPALYRAADALVCVSLAEGFGLCAIEAMACGRPAILSDMAPFTDHLDRAEALWADPLDPASIAAAMRSALHPATAARLGARGPATAARFGWDRVAAAHTVVHADLQGAPVHA